jgi:hypothetical protein
MVVFLLSAAASPAQVAADTADPRARKTWSVPRTPDGRPDLQGFWSNATTTPLERPGALAGKQVLTEEERAALQEEVSERINADRAPTPGDPGTYNEFWWERGSLSTQTSLIVDPADGRLPAWTPEAQTTEEARRRRRTTADSWEDRNLAERCITRGAPKLPGGYNNNFHILQTPGYVAILQEMIHEVRIIPLDGRPHVQPAIRLWLGDSRGHWEGDTLVVETTNYNDNIRFNSYYCCRGSGANQRIVERFTRIDADTIDYRFTVTDPTTFTKPFTISVPMRRFEGPIYEYACHEGNISMEHILRGARAQEKAAERNSKSELR